MNYHRIFRPFGLYLFISLAAGIWLGSMLPVRVVFPYVCFVGLLIAGIFYAVRQHHAILPIFLLLIFFYGIIGIQDRLHPVLPENHIVYHAGDTPWMITGQVVSFTRHEKYRSRVVLSCRSLASENGTPHFVSGKIFLNIYGREKLPEFGQWLRLSSKIRGIRNFQNPGGFDYRRFLKFKSIYATAWTSANKLVVLDAVSDTKYSQSFFQGVFFAATRKIEQVRNRFYRFVDNQTQGRAEGRVLVSLVTGKKEVLSDEVRDLFSKAGVSHLLAISGLHLGMVAFFFMWMIYRTLAFYHPWLVSGKARKIAGIAAMGPIFLYAVFSGFSAATQRAFIMVAFVIATYAFERRKDILLNICYAGLLILLIDCTSLFAVSFQLSFAAIAFIAAGLHLSNRYHIRIKNRWTAKTVSLLAVTFFAGLGTAPLTACYFNMLSIVSLGVNILMVPLFGCVILPLGLLSMAVFPFMEQAAALLILCSDSLIHGAIVFCQYLTQVPGSFVRISTPHGYQVAVFYICSALFFLFLNKKKIKWLIFAFVLLFFSAVPQYLNSGFAQQDPALEITILDVGQGSCAYIRTPSGKHLLVDGGGFSGKTTFDTGRHIIAPFLWRHRVLELDYVFLTHPENDHLRGLIFILENFKVGMLIKNRDVSESYGYHQMLRVCENKKINISDPQFLPAEFIEDGLKCVFLDPAADRLQAGSLNNASLVFQMVYGDFSMLFSGDILADREKKLCLQTENDLNSDILLCPHHGSATSSSKFFLDKIKPESVIISCGWKNRYGFPHRQILDRYRNAGISVYRTDIDGAVRIQSNGLTYNILTEKGT